MAGASVWYMMKGCPDLSVVMNDALSAQLPQVVATCVTTSFTERNLHPEKVAMVPTVLIGEHSFRACLYDCEKDILIISSRKSLSANSPHS